MPIFTAGIVFHSAVAPGATLFPDGREGAQLVLVEAVEEARPYPRPVDGAGRLEPLSTRARELRVVPATILLAACPLDGAGADEPVDEPRQPALAEQHRGGEVGHAEAPVRGVAQVEQHLVLVQREAVRGAKPGVEVADEGAVHAEEPAPGGELGRPEGPGVDRRCLHVQI